MLKKSIAAHIYSLLVADHDKHELAPEILKYIIDNYLPSGSGFDTELQVEPVLGAQAFTISFNYHHMDDMGGYSHWSEGVITVIPCFNGLDLDLVTTEDDEPFKEYVLDGFHQALNEEVRIPPMFGDTFRTWVYRKAQLSLLLNKRPELQVRLKLWRDGDDQHRSVETKHLNITAEEAAAIAQMLIGRD